jgi:hypothetical protein
MQHASILYFHNLPTIYNFFVRGVKDSETASDIKKAYHKAALKHHPDKVSSFLPLRIYYCWSCFQILQVSLVFFSPNCRLVSSWQEVKVEMMGGSGKKLSRRFTQMLTCYLRWLEKHTQYSLTPLRFVIHLISIGLICGCILDFELSFFRYLYCHQFLSHQVFFTFKLCG